LRFHIRGLLLAVLLIAILLFPARYLLPLLNYGNDPDESVLPKGQRVYVFGDAAEWLPVEGGGGIQALIAGSQCAVITDTAWDRDAAVDNSERPVHVVIIEGPHKGMDVWIRRAHLRSHGWW